MIYSQSIWSRLCWNTFNTQVRRTGFKELHTHTHTHIQMCLWTKDKNHVWVSASFLQRQIYSAETKSIACVIWLFLQKSETQSVPPGFWDAATSRKCHNYFLLFSIEKFQSFFLCFVFWFWVWQLYAKAWTEATFDSSSRMSLSFPSCSQGHKLPISTSAWGTSDIGQNCWKLMTIGHV